MNFYKVSLNNKISQLFGTEFLFSSPFPYFCNLSHKNINYQTNGNFRQVQSATSRTKVVPILAGK